MTIDTLAGYTVVELSTGVAGAYATKLFADAGADVIVVEPDDGSPLRRTTRSGQLPEGAPDGPLFAVAGGGKALAWSGSDRPRGPPSSSRAAHVVVADLPRSPLEEAGLLPRPRNVVVTISPHGRGPLEDAPGNDFTAQADQRLDRRSGRPTRPALRRRTSLGTGRGSLRRSCRWPRPGTFSVPASARHIDVSCAEAITIATNLYQDLMFRLIGGIPPGPGRMIMFPGIEATADGWVGLEHQLRPEAGGPDRARRSGGSPR